MRVRDAMTANVTACTLDSNLAGIASRMWLGACGAVPVVDEGGRVAGIVTDRDICFALAGSDRAATEIRVRELVARRPALYTCAADDDLVDALRRMRDRRVRRLPVVDAEGRLQGILSMSDAIAHAADESALEVGELMGALKTLSRPPARSIDEAQLHA
jgi:CBS domain-containing protein